MKILIDKKNRGSTRKLMVSGLICLNRHHQPILEVRRGMEVVSSDGEKLGKVAALIFQDDGLYALAILLGRLPDIREYHVVRGHLDGEVYRTQGARQQDRDGAVVDHLERIRGLAAR